MQYLRHTATLTPYEDAMTRMEDWRQALQSGTGPEHIWLLQHPPLFTAGTSAHARDLLSPAFPVHKVARGGKVTYHGPGQLVGYFVLDLRPRGSDLHWYVRALEDCLIQTLRHFGLKGFTIPGRTGVWVNETTPKKIAAIGVHVRKWITSHGISLNVNPDLSHFQQIVPCGISDAGVTSLEKEGIDASLEEVASVMQNVSRETFFRTRTQP